MYWTSQNLPTSKIELKRIISINKTIDENPLTIPFFKNIPTIRNANIDFSYSDKEIKEIISCKENKSYFLTLFYELIDKTPYNHQYHIIDSKNRFNVIIQSRQVAITDTLLLKALHEAMYLNKNVLFISPDKNTYIKLIKLYSTLPFFLKKGVLTIEDNKILFESLGSIKIDTNIKPCGLNYNSYYLDDLSYYEDKIDFKSIYPTISSINDRTLTISSIATNNNSLVYKLIHNKNFHYIPIDYKLVYNESLKKTMIGMIGVEKFAKEYENLFEGTIEYNRYINLESLLK